MGRVLMKLRHISIRCCLIFGLLCPVFAKPLSSEKIVFSSNRDGNWEIYIMNPDGTRQERLTYGRAVDCEPVISPTGDRILFTSNRGGTRDLYLMDVDGKIDLIINDTMEQGKNPRLHRILIQYVELTLCPET